MCKHYNDRKIHVLDREETFTINLSFFPKYESTDHNYLLYTGLGKSMRTPL